VALLRRILCIPPAGRPTLSDIMGDPWFKQFLPDLSKLAVAQPREQQGVAEITRIVQVCVCAPDGRGRWAGWVALVDRGAFPGGAAALRGGCSSCMAILCFSNHLYTLPPAAALLPRCTCSSTPQEAHRLSQLRQQMPDEFAGEVIEEEEEEGDAMEQGDVLDEVGAR
jgi:hypothetical protein